MVGSVSITTIPSYKLRSLPLPEETLRLPKLMLAPRVMAVYFSLIQTSKQYGHDPRRYYV